jgi:hypothetical protein
MTITPIVPFAEAHLAGAAEALARRHDLHRSALPLVAAGDSRRELEALWARPELSGAVALREGRVAGFVLARS